MEKMLTNKTVSLTELRDPAKVLANAGDAPVAVLNRNKVVGYFVPKSAVSLGTLETVDHADVLKILVETEKQDQPVLDYLQDK